MTDLPQLFVAYFKTAEEAERCAANVDDDEGEYLCHIERVERPWMLRMARPAASHNEADDFERQLYGIVSRYDAKFVHLPTPLDHGDRPDRPSGPFESPSDEEED